MLAARATPARAVAMSSSARPTSNPSGRILVAIALLLLEFSCPCRPSHRRTGVASARPPVYGSLCGDVQRSPAPNRPLDGNVGLPAGALCRIMQPNSAEHPLQHQLGFLLDGPGRSSS